MSSIVGLIKLDQSKIDAANPGVDGKVWSTALGIACLELKCASSKSNWEMVATKGRTFMSKILLAQGIEKALIVKQVDDVIEKALLFLKKNNF